MTTSTATKIIKSISKSQQEILNDILFLYNNGNAFDLDPTYSKGVFYKNGIVPEPIMKYDKFPQTPDTIQACSDNLPIQSSSINSICFDPPFVLSGKTYKESSDDSCKISKRFGCYYSFDELKQHYYGSLQEFHRILNEHGIVVFKCQDTISGGKQYMSSYYVMKSAIELGFYVMDLFVLEATSKMTSFGGRWKQQRHAMKYHSYFYVLRKQKSNLNYNNVTGI